MSHIDSVIEELEEDLKPYRSAFDEDFELDYEEDEEVQCCGCKRRGPREIININFSPVINASSNMEKKTKNSPLHELGSALASILGFMK